MVGWLTVEELENILKEVFMFKAGIVIVFIMHWLKAVYCTVPKHGDSQKIIKDGSKLQRWMPWGDPLEYQEKKELEM